MWLVVELCEGMVGCGGDIVVGGMRILMVEPMKMVMVEANGISCRWW